MEKNIFDFLNYADSSLDNVKTISNLSDLDIVACVENIQDKTIKELKEGAVIIGIFDFDKIEEIKSLRPDLKVLSFFKLPRISRAQNQKVNYVGVEAYPVADDEIQKLNYVKELDAENFNNEFQKIHETSWETKHDITPNFSLTKRQQFFEDITDKDSFNLIYFDAFGARVQPDLWTENIFKKMFEALKSGGVLVTYAAKGSVRRAMQSVGFSVERLEGPPGKREMLRAVKQAK